MNIVVLNKNNNKLGNGEGSVTPPTAVINSWVDPAALKIGETYTLKAGGKTYTATCRTNKLPIEFDNVS